MKVRQLTDPRIVRDLPDETALALIGVIYEAVNEDEPKADEQPKGRKSRR